MPYQKGYLLLFNGITDALRAMEKQNFGQAQELLCAAQIEAEELYLRAAELEKREEQEGGSFGGRCAGL